MPKAPPTEAERFGVDVRDPAKTAAGSVTPTNVAKKRPELLGAVRRQRPAVRREERDDVRNVELPPGGQRPRDGRAAGAGRAGRGNVDENERRVGAAPVHGHEVRRVVRRGRAEDVEDDRRLDADT